MKKLTLAILLLIGTSIWAKPVPHCTISYNLSSYHPPKYEVDFNEGDILLLKKDEMHKLDWNAHLMTAGEVKKLNKFHKETGVVVTYEGHQLEKLTVTIAEWNHAEYSRGQPPFEKVTWIEADASTGVRFTSKGFLFKCK